jgi:glucosyl-dolichyl phosphate glucuronosyltransferase
VARDTPAAIGVIIATYNRADLLQECLAHLARQSFAEGDEVIVVDNASSDRTQAVLRDQQRAFPVPLHILLETKPGKSHALMAALRRTRCDILAFTDDDVNVEAGWLNAIRVAMTAAGEGGQPVVLVGGPVEPRWERRAPFWLKLGRGYGRLAAPLALLDYGNEPVDLGARTLLGANLAVRRHVVEQLGGFASHLGKLRGTLLSGEDHDLCRRVQRAGFRARYCPTARVRHWVPDHRARLTYFLRWFFWSGITNAELDTDDWPTARAFCGVPLYVVRLFVAGSLGAFGAVATWRWQRAVDRATEAAFCVGYAARRAGLV